MFQTWLSERLSPETAKQIFLLSQLGLGALIVLGIFVFRPKQSESRFRVREGDLKPPRPQSQTQSDNALAEAKIRPPEQPLQLTGIRIDGAPHEILGVKANASPDEVQLAYRELMKRFHPDKIGEQGSRPWKDAQKIAEALNQARDRMTKKNRV